MASPSCLISRIKTRVLEVHFQEIIRGASVAFFFKVLGTAAAFVFSLLLARSLGAEQVGLYFLAITVAEVLNKASRLGLDQSAIALVGKHSTRQEWGSVQGVFRKSVLLILLVSLALTVVCYLLAPAIAATCFHEPRLSGLLRVICLFILPVALFNFFGEALKGLRSLHKSQFIISACHPLLLLSGIVLLAGGLNVLTIAWVYGIAACATALAGFTLWRRTTRHLLPPTSQFPTETLLATALPLFWANLLLFANDKMGTFALGYFASPSDVAVFTIAFRISMLATIVLMAFNAICAPKIAALHGQNDVPGLCRVARSTTLLLVITASPLLLGMLCYPGLVMGLFGAEFANHGAVLVVLVIGQGCNIATGPVGVLLTMTGRQHYLRNILFVTTPLHMLLQLVLAKYHGPMGAAWAITVNIALVNFSALFFVHKEFNYVNFRAKA